MSGGAVPTTGLVGPPATIADPNNNLVATNVAGIKAHSPAANGLGPLVRMRILKPANLPDHPDLAAYQTAGEQPQLSAFLYNVLSEGYAFTTQYWPKHFTVKARDKPSPPSTARVEVVTHEIQSSELPVHARAEDGRTTENWCGRTSIHENAAKAGTASWEEFDGGLRQDHSQHEKDYTPLLFDAHEVLSWPVEAQVGPEGDVWNEARAVVMEMAHNMPGPLGQRIFRVLVVTAKREGEFFVAQIPVDTTHMSGSKYRNDAKMTEGVYCSVEYGSLLENGTKVKWQMATASDAGGSLPMWVQKVGIPGAVTKDVGFFMEWVEKVRKGQA
jgi:hypothetical protein